MADEQRKIRIIEYGEKPADQFTHNPDNPRIHPQAQRDAVQGSLDTLGWIAPVIENRRTGFLIDGHERIWHALQTGDNVPYIVVDLSPEEEKQALASFDWITYMAEYDRDKLDTLLRDVQSDDERVQSLLAGLAEAQGLYLDPPEPAEDPGAQIDRADELQQKWNVQPGDVWVIVQHRLMCGDSTNADDVARLMAGEAPRLMVTDPPYGVEYDQEWRSSNRVGKVANDNNASWFDAWRLSPACVAYVWHATLHATQVDVDLKQAGYEIRAGIIWNKPRHVFSQGHYHWKHEPCFYVVKKGSSAEWIGDRKQNTVWDIEADEDAPGNHSTQKPVECMARPIRNHAGDVYDPFTGSGTTLVACEQTGRRGFGMEIHPPYVAVTLERLAGMGLEPERES